MDRSVAKTKTTAAEKKTPTTAAATATAARTRNWVKWVVGLGFWVQGFRCFPWLGVNFFLKDGVGFDPSSLQILLNSANLPMVAKPLYGLVSDAVYIGGQHRLPYVAIGALLQAISWLGIVALPAASISVVTLTLFLLLSNLGASIAEVANDAIVTEAGKQSKSQSGQLQSFAWTAASFGGAIGNLLGVVAISQFSPRTMFLLFAVLVILQLFITVAISESSLGLPKKANNSSQSSGIHKQISDLALALRKPEIHRSIMWFFASYAIVPLLNGTMFFYQTQHLKLDSSVVGLSKVFGQVATLGWSVMYGKKLKRVPARKILSTLQVTIAVFMVSDALFVSGFYRNMGVPDSVYVVIFSGLLEVLFMFKGLPFMVLISQFCPTGCEASIMAFLMSAVALSMIISGYLGVALASYMKVTTSDFSGLKVAILIQAACALLPVTWASWIPQMGMPGKKQE